MNIFANSLCELKFNDKYGGFIVATKDIKRGELLLTEKPTIVGPIWSSAICCINCYQESKKMCSVCKRAPMCSYCPEHDPFECDYLKNSILPENFLIDHFDTLSVLRLLCLRKNPKKLSDYDEIMKMESHCVQRQNTNIWRLHQKKIVEPLRAIGLLQYEGIPDEFIQRLCGILDVNAFEIRTNTPNEVRGLYPKAALLPHDCVPNTFISLDENKVMKIYASVAINAGGIIFNNYTDSLNETSQRQEHLRNGKYFLCTCNRCLDPTELQTHMSTLICQFCKGNVLHDTKQNIWQCIDCNKVTNNVDTLVAEANRGLSMANFDVSKLENIIRNYSHLLHPNHYLMLKAKQILAGILKVTTVKSRRFTAQRLLELCSDILGVLHIVQPGISRLTAIALYEQYNQIICLAQIDYESRSIKRHQYLTKLQKAEHIAKEAIGMLIYEPPMTSEGKLAKQAILELRELRQHIDDLQKP